MQLALPDQDQDQDQDQDMIMRDHDLVVILNEQTDTCTIRKVTSMLRIHHSNIRVRTWTYMHERVPHSTHSPAAQLRISSCLEG